MSDDQDRPLREGDVPPRRDPAQMVQAIRDILNSDMDDLDVLWAIGKVVDEV